jgi:hypothetical protein
MEKKKEQEQAVFILLRKRTFRRHAKIYIKNPQGVFVAKYVTFTTEHLIDAKLRSSNAKTKNAEYKTIEKAEIEALMSAGGYGTVFALKGDKEGKLKQTKIVHTSEDLRKAGLRPLFNDSGLTFDESKSYSVLRAEYDKSIIAEYGKDKPEPKLILAEKVDVSASIVQVKESARAAYKEKYGKEVPECVFNDIAFLDGMSNPAFDAGAYIEGVESRTGSDLPGTKEEIPPNGEPTIENLTAQYHDKFGKLPAKAYKNNADWLKGKLEE